MHIHMHMHTHSPVSSSLPSRRTHTCTYTHSLTKILPSPVQNLAGEGLESSNDIHLKQDWWLISRMRARHTVLGCLGRRGDHYNIPTVGASPTSHTHTLQYIQWS